MEVAECISCGTQIAIRGDVLIGTQVKCPKCEAELEVVWLDPLELDWPFDEEY